MDVWTSLSYITPHLILTIGAFLVLLLDFLKTKKEMLGLLAVFLLAGAFATLNQPDHSLALFHGYFVMDGFSYLFHLITFVAAILAVLVSIQSTMIPEHQKGEFFALMLLLSLFLCVMASSTNLFMIFLSIESVSLVSYVLTGFQKFNKRSSEASLKYLLFGSVSSAIMLFGMSLIFGLTGSLELSEIGQVIAGRDANFVAVIALVMMLAGLGFKISAAPFHMWAPDVYEGAPTPVAAFLTVAPKSLGFLVLIRVLLTAFSDFYVDWSHIIVGISILTMTVGNVIAIAQFNAKRLLAYSSIAQAGYILMGIAVSNETGIQAVLIYLIAYVFTNMGAFFVVSVVEQNEGTAHISAFHGLGEKNPALAASFTVFLISLAGIPPMAGFLGKWFVFASTIEGHFTALAVAAAINSAIAAFYYFKLVRAMYLVKPSHLAEIKVGRFVLLALCMTLIAVLAIGLYPNPLLSFVQTTISSFQTG